MHQDALLTLLVIITLGYLFGRIRLPGGLSFGAAGVIFVALAVGHAGGRVPEGIGSLGMLLFIYCLGLSAGPTFFRVLASHGRSLALLGALIVGVGVSTTWLIAKVCHLPVDLAAGILAGSMTSTPALAAAAESLPSGSQVAVGYGIAYPFGVIGVVLFVQLLPRLMRKNYAQLDLEAGAACGADTSIVRILIEVLNPAVEGKSPGTLRTIDQVNCQISRVLRENRLEPVSGDFELKVGQRVLVVGQEEDIQEVVELLGRASPETGYILDAETQRMKVVVSSKSIVGKSLRDLKLLSRYGVTIARVTRHDVEFVPRCSEVIEFGDALTAVGEPAALKQFAALAGHRARTFDETDLISLAVGVMLGVMVGRIRFSFGGFGFSLGSAGGPLLVGVLLGHFGRVGPLVGHLPRAARMLLTDIGLAFFLASAGVSAGSQLVPVVEQYGLVLCGAAVLITLLPMVLGFLLAHFGLKMKLLQTLGGVCGGMTSTPGLGLINAESESQVPAVSYATVYPVALILLTILAPVLVSTL